MWQQGDEPLTQYSFSHSPDRRRRSWQGSDGIDDRSSSEPLLSSASIISTITGTTAPTEPQQQERQSYTSWEGSIKGRSTRRNNVSGETSGPTIYEPLLGGRPKGAAACATRIGPENFLCATPPDPVTLATKPGSSAVPLKESPPHLRRRLPLAELAPPPVSKAQTGDSPVTGTAEQDESMANYILARGNAAYPLTRFGHASIPTARTSTIVWK